MRSAPTAATGDRDARARAVALARKVGNRAFTAMLARNKPGAAGTSPLPATSFGPRGELQTPLAEGVRPMPFIRHFEQPPTEGKKNLDFEQAGTQKMVPSAKDLVYVRAVMNPDDPLFVPAWRGLTPSQVWALVAADHKGFIQRAHDFEACERRLDELNQSGATYARTDLPEILDYMRTRMRLATNFALSQPPPRDTPPAKDAQTLEEVLMADRDGLFRNVWETEASQASTAYTHRGGVEERMGYAAALERTGGEFFDFFGMDNTFRMEPRARWGGKNPDEMPKYAALIPQNQPAGVANRYGKTVVYWKPRLRTRTTHTAGDSWSSTFPDRSVVTYAGATASWAIFPYTDLSLARIIAAQATGGKRDPKFWAQLQERGAESNEAYIESQIHGSLGWTDVDEIVVNWGPPAHGARALEDYGRGAAKEMVARLRQFGERKRYDFSVRLGQYMGPAELAGKYD